MRRRDFLLGGLSVVPALAQGAASTGPVRQPWQQPFASRSVWNRPIGSGARWSDPYDPGTAQLIRAHGALNVDRWSQPHYIGSAHDPLVTVICNDTIFPVRPQRLHIPLHARPDPSSDAHMAFFDLTQPRWMWSYWGCTLDNRRDVTGGIHAGLGGVYDVCGDGVLAADHIGAGDYNFAIGTIRAWELTAGAIRHTLRYGASPDLIRSPQNTGHPERDWMAGIPWPDRHEDWFGDRLYRGHLLYGSTIGIPATVDLAALGLSPGGMILARCLQEHGAIMRDMAGQDAVVFYAEPRCLQEHAATTAAMAADLPAIVPQLRVLRNQGPHSVNGGGRPLVPGPPPLTPQVCR